MIQLEELRPGDRLPAEREMAQEFGVSRTTLRDAIRDLERLGYVEVKQGNGSTIREPDGKTLALPFRSLLETSPQVATDLLEFRRLLEPQISALAAKRRSKQHVALLNASLARQDVFGREDCKLGDNKLTDEDIYFHTLISEIANNSTVIGIYGVLQSLLYDLRTKMLTGDKPDLGLKQHRRIANAIIEQDEGGAYEAMLEHLLSVEASIIT